MTMMIIITIAHNDLIRCKYSEATSGDGVSDRPWVGSRHPVEPARRVVVTTPPSVGGCAEEEELFIQSYY